MKSNKEYYKTIIIGCITLLLFSTFGLIVDLALLHTGLTSKEILYIVVLSLSLVGIIVSLILSNVSSKKEKDN